MNRFRPQMHGVVVCMRTQKNQSCIVNVENRVTVISPNVQICEHEGETITLSDS